MLAAAPDGAGFISPAIKIAGYYRVPLTGQIEQLVS